MKKSSIIFLQIVTVLIGIGVLAALLIMPHSEGRNVDATIFEIYFKDPFLAYVYLSSIPFFIALYKAFKILGYIRENKAFTQDSVKALGTIKYSMLITAAAILVADIYIFITMRGKDDFAGFITLSVIIIFVLTIIAMAAATFERVLRNAVEIKSENELTV